MTTAFPLPEATGWTDAAAEETKKLLIISKNNAAPSKPKIIEVRKSFPFNFSNFPLLLPIDYATYKFWHN